MSSATHPTPSSPQGRNEETIHTNGSPAPAPTPTQAQKLRSSERGSGRSRKLAPLLVACGVGFGVLVIVAVYMLMNLAGRGPYTGPTWTVVKEKLRVTIIERGTLESAENSDIICRVKAKSQGSTVATTIKWVIEDGTQVEAGDLLMDLDDSGFQENLKTQRNKVNEGYAKWIDARANCVIVASENESSIRTAEVNKDLAELSLKQYMGHRAGSKVTPIDARADLQKYLRTSFEADVRAELTASDNQLSSEYSQTLSDIEGKIENARSDRELWLDKASWSMRMVQKGFYSRSQADSDQSRLASMEIALRKVQGELDIFRKFVVEKNVTDLWGKLKEAERALKRVMTQADSKIETAKANETSNKAIYNQEIDRLRDMEKEEKYYRITAPQDGMVVYFLAEQSRTGGGTQQGIVAQGEPVREGQKLIRLPNLAKMLVNVRVHEAMVSKINDRGEKSKATGYSDMLRAASSFGQNHLWGLAGYQLGFDELRDDHFKDKDHIIVREGLKAYIRIDAFPGKQYLGNVKRVADVASAGDFFSSDIKVYPTYVSINSAAENLKPGMSAEVTILADETDAPVLVMPIQAVVGNISMGAKRKCYVLDAKGLPQERDIVVGLSNDKLVEVTSGVEEGEKVVQNPRSLIPENSGMKPGTPGTRRGAEFGDDGGAGGKKGKKGKKGAEVPPGGLAPDGKAFQRPDEPLPPMDRIPGKKQ